MALAPGRLAGRALRGGWAASAGLVLVVALGGGATLGATVAAYRTDRAWGDYVTDAEVSEVVVNPSLKTKAIDDAVRSFDGVERVRVDSLLAASVSITGPLPRREALATDPWLQVRGSVDGRYIDVDRPAVHDGRVPSGQREIFVSSEYRSELERIEGRPLQVGDAIDVGFFAASDTDTEADPTEVIEPIGVESLRISGFGVLAHDVLPEHLFPRQQLLVSSDVTARYWCLPDVTFDPAMSAEDAFTAVFQPGCSALYDFWSLDLAEGTTTESIRNQFEAVASKLNAEIPAPLAEVGASYAYISQERSKLDEAVHTTTRPTVIALQAFAAVAGAATLAVSGIMVARQASRAATARRDLRALGATRRQLAAWSCRSPLVAATFGLAASVGVSLSGSRIGPIGSVRSVTPAPGTGLPAVVAVPVVVILAVCLSAIIATVAVVAALRATAPASTTSARSGRVARLVAPGRPSITTGIDAALGTRTAGAGIAAVAASVIATALVIVVIVFGASLSALVDTPDAYGWPWDTAIITGAGYGDTDVDVIRTRLSRADVRDDIVETTFLGFDPSILFGDRPAPVIFGYPDGGALSLPLLRGRSAVAPGEAVLGTDTAAGLGLDVGSELTVSSQDNGAIDLKVVGIGVLPSLGPFVSDRTGLRTGAFVVTGTPVHDASPAFTGLRFRQDVDPAGFLEKIGPELPTFSTRGEPPITHATPVRSAEIDDVSELRGAPIALGALLLVGLALGLGVAVALSVHDRRHDLAVLRAVGFTAGDVRRSVWCQGFTIIAVGVLLGVPAGVVGGRVAWRVFADRLGVVPAGVVPPAWITGAVAVTILLGWVAAALPARSAARRQPAADLRRSA